MKEDNNSTSTSGSQAVKTQTVFSTEVSGSYKDLEPVETQPSNSLSSQTATVEIAVTPDDSYSTVSSGPYAEAQPVQSCNVPSSLTVRTETVVSPEDCYSTTSGPYNNPEPVVIQPGNDSTSQTVRTEMEASPGDSYSTISGPYHDPEPVVIQPGNDSTSQTVRTEVGTSQEDGYSTISGIYTDPHDVQLGRPASAGRDRLRSPGVESSDRKASPSEGVKERSIRCGRPKLACALMMTSVVAVTLTVTLVGVFLGGPMEDNHSDDLHPATSSDTEIPESTHGSATTTSITLDPTTTIQPNSSTTDETPGRIPTHRNITFTVGEPKRGTLSLSAIAVSSANEIFVADRYNHRIHIHNMEGAYLGNFTTLVPGYVARVVIPGDMSIDVKDNLWVVGRMSLLCPGVVQYSKEGQGLSVFKQCSGRYGGIAIDLPTNHIVLKVVNELEVHIYRPDGSLVRKIGERQFAYSNAVAVNSIDGSILMLKENSVHLISCSYYGQDRYSFGSRGSGEGELMVPTGICTDSSGQVIVAERRNRRVSVFTRHGHFVRHVDTGRKMVELVAVGPKGQLVVTYLSDDTVTIFSTY
ncbi:PREDICTED: mucin-5AC-like [Branchiostoma belcheri]|uniref:Mucin-5AC-like n=1 Tax=Branchiostoma belcheri TaxID=7741 RepID=A0A6P4ZTQ8_BRABE|nr:PREDICTED: mucin-5AC-like [Branchiostoma belcheri]